MRSSKGFVQSFFFSFFLFNMPSSGELEAIQHRQTLLFVRGFSVSIKAKDLAIPFQK